MAAESCWEELRVVLRWVRRGVKATGAFAGTPENEGSETGIQEMRGSLKSCIRPKERRKGWDKLHQCWHCPGEE